MTGAAALQPLTSQGPVRLPGTTDIYCFPPAGGGPGTFAGWVQDVPGGSQWYAASYPSANAGAAVTASVWSIERISGALANELAVRPGQHVFFGHSMGALVAFELTRELYRRGQRGPVLLAVAGHASPELPLRHESWHQLPSHALWAQVADLGGTPAAVLSDPELRSVLEPRLRADLAACETYRYRPGPPLYCDVLAFAAAHDEEAPPGAVAAWRNHTLGAFRSVVFPGSHFFINTEHSRIISELMGHLPAG